MSTASKKQTAKEKVITRKAKEAAGKARALPDKVLYISKYEEIQPISIYVMGEEVASQWDAEHEYLMWYVPAHLVERFAMHEFVVQGRIIKGED